MPFPDLQLVQDVLRAPGDSLPYVAEATGVPDSGSNVIALPFVDAGIDPAFVDPSRLKILFDPDPGRGAGGTLSPGVTDLRYVSLSADRRFITLSFAQSGVGTVRVSVELNHTIQGVGSLNTPLIVGSGGGAGGAPAPSGFNVSLSPVFVTTQEIGAILANPQFNAGYTPAATEAFAELSDDDGNPTQDVLGALNPITRPHSYSKSAIGALVNFILNANDGVNGDSAAVAVSWQPRCYYGVDPSGALATEADIEALANNALQPSKALNFTFSANNEYVYYAFPVAYPAAPLDFQIGPFPGGFVLHVASVAVTAGTPGAPVVNYQIWRSTNALNTTISGPQTLVVQA